MIAEIFGIKIPIDEKVIKNDSIIVYFGWDALTWDSRQRLADKHNVAVYYDHNRNKSYLSVPSRMVLIDGVRSDGIVCECGADKHKTGHLFYCPKWERYGSAG